MNQDLPSGFDPIGILICPLRRDIDGPDCEPLAWSLSILVGKNEVVKTIHRTKAEAITESNKQLFNMGIGVNF